ncbi:MAG: thermonuclease family protein [Acidobacteriota bacterium]
MSNPVRFACSVFIFAIVAGPLRASTMAEVVGVLDAHKLVVRQDGAERIITLAGVRPADFDWGVGAVALRQLIQDHWIFLEPSGRKSSDATFYVYRSPDALPVNVTMIRDGYAVCSCEESTERDEYSRAETWARENRRGIWSERGAAAEWESRHRHTRFLGELPYFSGASVPSAAAKSKSAKAPSGHHKGHR